MKAYYEDDAVRVFNADCLDILPRLEPAQLIVTSPDERAFEAWHTFLAGKAYGQELRGCAGRPCVCPYCGHLWISHNALGCCWDEECNCNKVQGQEDKAP